MFHSSRYHKGTLLLRYLAARWRYPGFTAKHYIQSGLDLERRAQHLSVFWIDHLSRTRAAQARWVQTCLDRNADERVMTVLGAGPLFDFNAAALARSFQRFTLVDANPLSISSWSRLNVPVQPVITDISNSMAQWTAAIQAFGGSWKETLLAIEKLGGTPIPAYVPATGAVLSLNILSQLEVGWQELVESLLVKRFGARFIRNHEQDWLNAIRPASRRLIEQHLAALQASRARDILLITDAEYVEYTGRLYSTRQSEPPPLQWTESGWQPGPGIRYEVTPALEGITLDTASLNRWLPSYRIQWRESWIWHIAPCGTETAKYGKLHRVVAFALRQFDSVAD